MRIPSFIVNSVRKRLQDAPDSICAVAHATPDVWVEFDIKTDAAPVSAVVVAFARRVDNGTDWLYNPFQPEELVVLPELHKHMERVRAARGQGVADASHLFL